MGLFQSIQRGLRNSFVRTTLRTKFTFEERDLCGFLVDADPTLVGAPEVIRDIALLYHLNERHPGRLDAMAETNLANAMAQAYRHGR